MADPKPAEQPAPAPSAPPPAAEILPAVPTEELRKLRSALLSNIPGDGTWSAAVARILGHLLDLNLLHPDRTERDAQAAAAAADAKARADTDALAARHAAEVKAAEATSASDAEKQALADKHAAEQAALERDKRLKELDAEQAAEREAFAQHQREQRAKAVEPAPMPPPQPQPQPPDRAGASTGL